MRPITRVRAASAAIALATLVGTAGALPASAAPAAPQAMNPACATVPKTTTEQDGVPGPIFWKRLQCMASRESERPYTGPIDGDLARNSWLGVSARLKVGGYYKGALSDENGAANITALQYWAVHHLRPLWVNGKWDADSYRGVAYCLNREF